jgi:DME family drug/metabolite transporter
MNRFDFLLLNLLRTSLSAVVLFLPATYYGFAGGIGYAFLSGTITLAIGDSLFLLSIREMGASIATPVVYVYVLLVQLTATTVGETVPLANVVAATMVIAGIFILSRGGTGRPRARGICLALGAGIVWTAGQDLIRLATSSGADVVTITFSRNLAAAVALAAVVLVTGKFRSWPRGISGKDFGFLSLIAISDLALGSLLYVYSISLVGVAVTVILTSLSPLLTQVFSRALGKESPGPRDFVGGFLIVSAVILAVVI